LTVDQTQIEHDWYTSAFGPLYPILYAHRTVAAARPEAQFAIDQLAITPRDKVLDLCCGNGRHLAHILDRAPKAVGFDYSPHLLQLARATTQNRARFVRGDMRRLPFVAAFDVLLNFFTSFGYFQDEEDNRATARALARALRPGGRFFIDFLNPAHLRATLNPETTRQEGDFHIVERRWIDEETQRINRTTQVIRDGQIFFTYTASAEIYTPEDLSALLRACGFEIAAIYGNHDGQPIDDTQPRMIITGHRVGEHA